MSTEQEPPHISKKQALKLAGWKPVKNQTRSDLLVYGGWLTSRWEWSRDIDVSLDAAIANSRALGEDVRIVGNPTPAERRKAKGRKPLGLTPEPPEIKVPKVPPLAPLELAPPILPAPPVKDDSEPQEVQPLEALADVSLEAQVPIAPPPRTPLPPMEFSQGTQTTPAPDPVQASSLLLQRFLIAASLCSVALFLGYYKLAGTLFVSILLLADAFFILTTSLIALKHRRTLAARRKATPVTVVGAQQGNPQPVG